MCGILVWMGTAELPDGSKVEMPLIGAEVYEQRARRLPGQEFLLRISFNALHYLNKPAPLRSTGCSSSASTSGS